jgi:hypothetical protein
MSNWSEQDTKSGTAIHVTPEKERLFNEVKAGTLPVIQREADGGVKPIKPVEYQPVRSPGRFEAEFGIKNDDIIFHVWPWAYHLAEKEGQTTPPFLAGTKDALNKAMGEIFYGKFELTEDFDVGAYTVVVTGWGAKQFARDLAITAVKRLHELMGGT